MNEEQRCGTCRHWHQRDDLEADKGFCSAIGEPQCCLEHELGIGRNVALLDSVNMNGSNEAIRLFTLREFGCVLWEPKEIDQ